MSASKNELKMARANNLNRDEGHLGGYIRASPNPDPSGLNVEHGDPATWTPTVWQWAYGMLGVRSVLDVGCGEGHAANFFRELGCRVCGIDGSVQAKRDSVIADCHVVHDFITGPYLAEGEFDLVWSCEFVEHVDARYSPNFLATFGCSRKFIMMTYAIPGQGGWHHVNEQPALYWIEKIEEIGFRLDQTLTEESRRVAEPGYYRDTGLLFRRKGSTW